MVSKQKDNFTEKRFLSSYIGKKGIGSGNAYRTTCLPPMSEKLHRRNDARGDEQMSNYEIPYWKKYTLSIEEAAAYFRIGEGKLRKLVSENPNAEYLLWNGNRVQIKRERFERFVDTLSAI